MSPASPIKSTTRAVQDYPSGIELYQSITNSGNRFAGSEIEGDVEIRNSRCLRHYEAYGRAEAAFDA